MQFIVFLSARRGLRGMKLCRISALEGETLMSSRVLFPMMVIARRDGGRPGKTNPAGHRNFAR